MRGRVRLECTRTRGSRQPSNRSELALHLLAALSFADSTLLTLIRCPYRGRLLVQRFPARPLHVPLRADRCAQGLSASSPAPPGACAGHDMILGILYGRRWRAAAYPLAAASWRA